METSSAMISIYSLLLYQIPAASAFFPLTPNGLGSRFIGNRPLGSQTFWMKQDVVCGLGERSLFQGNMSEASSLNSNRRPLWIPRAGRLMPFRQLGQAYLRYRRAAIQRQDTITGSLRSASPRTSRKGIVIIVGQKLEPAEERGQIADVRQKKSVDDIPAVKIEPATIISRDRFIKTLALILLVIQNASTMLCVRYTRMSIAYGASPPYLSSTAVVTAEFLKLATCIILLTVRDPRGVARSLWTEIFVQWRETAKVSVPALIYMLQNNLLYVAASNLDAATCQITYQIKILTTAIFAVTMLKQSIPPRRWGALLLLVAGIALVQCPQLAAGAAAAAAPGNAALGLSAAVAACFMSGFAGVWFEKVLKTSRTTLLVRNVQLALVGGGLALLGAACKDGAAISAAGFFQGYTPLVWAVVAQVGLGGLIVAVVVKYADNLQKGFATSISVVVSGLVSYFLIPSFRFRPSATWVLGGAVVLLATYLYSLPDPHPAAAAAGPAGRPGSAGPARRLLPPPGASGRRGAPRPAPAA